MKPTQEQILSALNKLVRENKTELKAEKIELNLVNDFDTAWVAGFKFIEKAINIVKEMKDGWG